jgi:nucleoid DNA-binding protein
MGAVRGGWLDRGRAGDALAVSPVSIIKQGRVATPRGNPSRGRGQEGEAPDSSFHIPVGLLIMITRTHMPNLTKRELVMQISKDAGLIQAEVFAVIQHTLDAITAALASGRDVELRNFGVFEVRLTKSRVGRNPKKPEKDVAIPARATVKFKAGKIMRQRVLLRTSELSGEKK